MDNIIAGKEERRKYIYKIGLNFLIGVPQRRIQKIILAIVQKGDGGKMQDYGKL